MATNERTTFPPCDACNAHSQLQKHIDEMDKLNIKQHSQLIEILDKAISDIKWMGIIGKWILASLLGYFVAIGYFIFTQDVVTSSDLKSLTKEVRKGETLHYKNVNNIRGMNAEIKILKNIVLDKR